MKRQKRDRSNRAYSKGYQAGVEGRSRDICPFDALDARTNWMAGWREGRIDQHSGYTGIAGIQNLKNIS